MALQTRAQVDTTISTDFANNTTGDISAQDLREGLTDIIDSALVLGDAEVRVISMALTAPPGGESDRDAYVVAATATGDWAGQEDDIAIYDAGASAWFFVTPSDGQAVWNLADDTAYRWDADASPPAWAAESGGAEDPDTLKSDETATLTVGYAHTADNDGTQSSGTYTPDEAGGAMKTIVNGGAFTLAPPTNNTSLVVQMTNNGSAGAITTSGFTIVTGDTLTTTDGDDFFLYITKVGSFSHLHVTALQ